MHSKGLVCVFARIFSRLGNIHLVEFELVDTFAAQVFERDAAAPQVPGSQACEAVWFVHFKHIALQHGVVCVALYLNTVIGKYVAVVFDVLAKFEFYRVFQPWLKPGQNLITRQLSGRVRVVVGKRNVSSLPRFDTKADAYDLGAHLVKRGGLGVQRDQLSRFQFGQPGAQSFPGKDGVKNQCSRRAGDTISYFGLVKQAGS